VIRILKFDAIEMAINCFNLSKRNESTVNKLLDLICLVLLVYSLGFSVIKSHEVERAMRTVKREDFCRSPQFAYKDAPQAIGTLFPT
jgi:hypothetical protein